MLSMGALDTVKDIGRLASTATLSKDVIDLLKEKITLLTEQIATLQKENTDLKAKVYELEQELKSVKPKGDLAADTVRVLRLLFDNDGLTVSQIAGFLGLAKGMAEYHSGALRERKMIAFPMVITMGEENSNYLTQKGREYLVKGGHV